MVSILWNSTKRYIEHSSMYQFSVEMMGRSHTLYYLKRFLLSFLDHSHLDSIKTTKPNAAPTLLWLWPFKNVLCDLCSWWSVQFRRRENVEKLQHQLWQALNLLWLESSTKDLSVHGLWDLLRTFLCITWTLVHLKINDNDKTPKDNLLHFILWH